MGALANEGGLGRDDFGAITIRPDFSIVELPSNLDPAVLDKLRDTRIGGRPIEIKPDRGVPNRRPSGGGYGGRRDNDRGGDRFRRDDRPRYNNDRRDDRRGDDRPARKPRHKG